MTGLNTALPRGAATQTGGIVAIPRRGRSGPYSTGGGVSSLVADHLMPAGAPVEAGALLSLSTPLGVLRVEGLFGGASFVRASCVREVGAVVTRFCGCTTKAER